MTDKVIVTHFNPDFDGATAIWLLKRFHPDFKNAQVKFVDAGSTWANSPPNSDNIVHVDTGGGRFDHHNTNEYTCAAKLVWEWLKEEFGLKDEAIERLIKQVVAIDHAKDLLWPEAYDDRYDMMLPNLISGMNMMSGFDDLKVIELSEILLDSLYLVYKAKIDAEEVLAKGKKFETRWGKGIACLTSNELVLQLGEKLGYSLVVRKDPKKGNVRIYGRNDRGVDLTEVYHLFTRLDPKSTWFLHASKCLLLNGSSKRSNMVATKLELDEIVRILERV